MANDYIYQGKKGVSDKARWEDQPKQFRGMFMKKSDVAPLIHGYGPFGSPATELQPSDIKQEGDFKTAGGYTIGWSDAAKARHKAEKHPITESGQVVLGFKEQMAQSRANALRVGAKPIAPKEFSRDYVVPAIVPVPKHESIYAAKVRAGDNPKYRDPVEMDKLENKAIANNWVVNI